jgi:hypothetical protein
MKRLFVDYARRVARRYMTLALLASIGALEAPASADDAPASPVIPAGYHEETRPRWGLVFWGSAAFVVSYVGAVGGAKSADSGGWLYVPLAGPFVNVAVRDTCKTDACSTADLIERIFWTLDGLGQVAGVTMSICGFAFPKRTLVPDGSPSASAKPGFRWSLRPHPLGRGIGLGFAATF